MKLLYRFKWWRMNRRRKKRLHKIGEIFPLGRITPLQKLFEEGKIYIKPISPPPEYRIYEDCFRRGEK